METGLLFNLQAGCQKKVVCFFNRSFIENMKFKKKIKKKVARKMIRTHKNLHKYIPSKLITYFKRKKKIATSINKQQKKNK